MTIRRTLRIGCALFAGTAVLALAVPADARGGGRGGGGGGRSISRGGGPASGGSFHGGGGYGGGGRSPSRQAPPRGGSVGQPPRGLERPPTQRPRSAEARPAQRPAQQAPIQQRPAQRPAQQGAAQLPTGETARTGERATPRQEGAATREDRAGTRQESAATRQASAEDRRQTAQDDRLQGREEAREDWQDHRQDLQEDRQDFWDDELDDIDGVWVGGWGNVHVYDADDFWAGVAVIAVGSALTAAAFDAMKQDSGCEMTPVSVEGAAYYYCAPNWYARALDGGSTTYVVVKPPPGY